MARESKIENAKNESESKELNAQELIKSDDYYISKIISDLKPEQVSDLKLELKQSPQVQNYLHQRIRFDSFEEILKVFDENTKGDNEENLKTRNQIIELIQNVKYSVFSYYASILKIENMKLNKFRMEDEEFLEELKSRDQNRRLVHNGLITNLGVLTRHCGNKIIKDLGIDISDKLFNQRELGNRDLIADWAYSTAEGERVLEIIRKIEEKEKAE